MELLYVWINKSKKHIFEKQSIPLTSEYYIVFNPDSKKLEINKNIDYFNIFKEDNIVNVSAIVGENGSGKTTILDFIVENSLLIHRVDDEDYEAYNEREKEYGTSIEVYKLDTGEIKVTHNIEDGFRVYLDGEILDDDNIIDYNDSRIKQRNLDNVDLKENISIIPLTNATYVESSGVSYGLGYGDTLHLNPETIKYYSNNFFEMKTGQTNLTLIPTNFNLLNRVFTSKNNINKFQNILYSLYMKKLIMKDENRDEVKSNSGKFLEKIKLSSDNYIRILEGNDIVVKGFNLHDEYKKTFNEKLKIWKNIKIKPIEDVVINNLMFNFILELDYIYDILNHKTINNKQNINSNVEMLYNECKKIVTKKDFKELTKAIIRKRILSSNLQKEIEQTEEQIYAKVEESYEKIKNEIELEYRYFKNAEEEISKLQKITKDLYKSDNNFPQKDLAFQSWLECSYEHNHEEYLAFLDYIYTLKKGDTSFVLKYLNIDFDNMSSGERAYLNFFSWLNSMDFFNEINPNAPKGLKSNVLLLIDEIDLYLHPEWQTTFIDKLLSDLKSIMNDRKIQVIFTTHSPIMLSDIPKSNVVFLKKTIINGKKKHYIMDRNEQSNTFGANIYDLFNNSFFLSDKGIVGSFALKKINKTFKELSRRGEVSARNRFIITSIGEPLAKARLEELIGKDTTKNNLQEDEIVKLRELKIELSSSLSKINSILGDYND